MSVVKSTIASIFSKISRRRCAGRLEDIYGLTTNRLAEEGFDRLPVDDIRGGTDEVRDIAGEAGIGEQAERMRGIQLDEDVSITVWKGCAPRDRPDDGSMRHHAVVYFRFVSL